MALPPDKDSIFPMLEIASNPSLPISVVKGYMAGKISLEEIFANITDTVTGEKTSPEHAADCTKLAHQLNLPRYKPEGQD